MKTTNFTFSKHSLCDTQDGCGREEGSNQQKITQNQGNEDSFPAAKESDDLGRVVGNHGKLRGVNKALSGGNI